MIEVKQISSVQNPQIKKLLLLKDKSKARKKTGLFVLEGKRELQLALKANYIIDTLFFNKTIISEQEVQQLLTNQKQEVDYISISKEVYQKIAYRETTEGIVALVKTKSHALDHLKFKSENALLLVAEAPEKPGNIGALLRTADAANLDAVLIANPKGDLYNPNTIRSSVGCVFTNAIGLGTSAEIISFLKTKGIKIYCGALSASKNYTEVNFTGPTAIVVGTEATGLTEEWLRNASENMVIPMRGEIDSMNVSVSAAILIFEAVRQRLK